MRQGAEHHDKYLKKQTAAITFSNILVFAASIVIPNIIAVAIAGKMTQSFCNDNADICSQYHNNGEPTFLVETIKNGGYLLAGMSGTLFGIVAGVALLFLSLFPYLCKKENDSEETSLLMSVQESENRPSLVMSFDNASNQSSNYCCLFKKFKDYVCPTNIEVYQFLVTSATLLAAAVFTAYITSLVSGDICGLYRSAHLAGCEKHFPGANQSQLQTTEDFSNTLYKTVITAGIILSVVTTLIGSVGAMTIAACINKRTNLEEEIELLDRESDDTDPESLLLYL